MTIIGMCGWGDVGQISLTHRPGADDRFFDGVGKLPNGSKERYFIMLNELCHNTYLESILNLLPFKLGRLRIMRARSRTCYSVHRDHSMRVHLPLVTNPQALMLFPDHGVIAHLPANGTIYLTDTRQRHTAMNGGLDDRYHLVGALWEDAAD